MPSITGLQANALPGRRRTFSAKTAAATILRVSGLVRPHAGLTVQLRARARLVVTLRPRAALSVSIRPKDPTMTQITVGDEQELKFTFTDLTSGALANPTGITLKIKKPDGALEADVTQVTMANLSTGVWQYFYQPSQVGRYHYRLTTTGALKKAYEGHFDVGKSEFVS